MAMAHMHKSQVTISFYTFNRRDTFSMPVHQWMSVVPIMSSMTFQWNVSDSDLLAMLYYLQ